MKVLLLAGVLAGCAADPGTDVVGPFTGDVHRFAVDAIAVPHDDNESHRYGADLDGDGEPENQLGVITALLSSINDLSIDGADMIASGALASSVELQADDLDNDDSVGVRYLGAGGEAATVAGGRLVGGAFRSNRTRETRVPGRAVVRLPIYTNADPLALELEGLELDLDPDGRGGFDAIVRGGVRAEVARDGAYAGLLQMCTTEPGRHLVFMRGLDRDHDGAVSSAELDDSVISLLVAPDLRLFDGDRFAPRPAAMPGDALSFAFAVHLTPCEAGGCVSRAPVERCRDRLRDGDETDIDCGGSCQKCADARSCGAPADCQSNACDAGHCRASSCSDQVRDGFESDVDCGGACGTCAIGRDCAVNGDCASGSCDGTCVP